NEMVLLADEIKKYDTAKLIEFLQEQENLELNELVIKILENEKINGYAFINITKEELRDYNMKERPVKNFADFTKKYKKKKLRSFFSYKTKKDLEKVLGKYGIDSNNIESILPFKPSKFVVEILGLRIIKY